MRLDTSQQMRTDMRLRMAPRMIQSMEILQLPLMALQERIDQELSENPVLVDLRESPTAESDPETDAGAEPEAKSKEPEESTEFEGMDDVDDWSDRHGESHRLSRAALGEEADRKHDAMQNMASRPQSLHDDLADQLGFLDTDPTIRTLALYLIYNLDENGYLTLDLADVAREAGVEATMEQVEEALSLVQRLDPPGIGARNLRECLLLQLTADTPCRDVLHTLIADHLEDLQQNRLPAIEKKTQIPIVKIKEAIEHL
ncbi:MAG: RNA polymerase sigma-54 factor, partial [Isosphaeraceae bacterium]